MSLNGDYEEQHDNGGSASTSTQTRGRNSKGKAVERSVKKRKLNRACDVCRKRKVRCDFVELPSGGLDQCLNCFSSKIECTFKEDAKPRSDTKSYIRDLENKVQRAEQMLALLCPDEHTRRGLVDGTLESPPPTPTSMNMDSEDSQDVGHNLEVISELIRSRLKRHEMPDSDENGDECGHLVPSHHPSSDTDTDNRSHFFLGESSESSMVLSIMQLKDELKNDVPPPQQAPPPSGVQKFKDFRLPLFRRDEYWSPPPWEDIFWKSQTRDSPFDFPEPQLMRSMISLYFEHCNSELPLIHRPTLERQLKDNLHHKNVSFATTLLLICAMGANWSDDPAVFLTASDIEAALSAKFSKSKRTPSFESDVEATRQRWRNASRHLRGWKWFDQAWAAQTAICSTPSLYKIQSCVLSALYLRNTSYPQGSWTLIGIGLRLLQDVGGHRRTTIDPHNLGTDSPFEAEHMKRAAWVLFILDRDMSCATGRPCAIQDEAINLALPMECDDEFWDSEDSQERFRQPEGRPSLLAAFCMNIKLHEVLSLVLRTIYPVKDLFRFTNMRKATWDQYIVSEIDSALNTWAETVPAHLRWNPREPNVMFLDQSGHLYATYYHVQILTHRPFIPSRRRPATLPFPSLTICTNAARSITRIGTTLLERHPDGSIPMILLPTFTAGVVLLLNAWEGRSRQSGAGKQFQRDIEDAKQCLRIIRVLEKRCFAAGMLWDILHNLATTPYHESQAPSSTASQSYRDNAAQPRHDSEAPASSHHSLAQTAYSPTVSIPFSSSHNLSVPPTPTPSAIHLSPSLSSTTTSSIPSAHPFQQADAVLDYPSYLANAWMQGGHGFTGLNLDGHANSTTGPSDLYATSSSPYDAPSFSQGTSRSDVGTGHSRFPSGSYPGSNGNPLWNFNQDFIMGEPSAFSSRPLSSAGIDELGIPDLWDWALPTQDDLGMSDLLSDSLFQWGRTQGWDSSYGDANGTFSPGR